MPIPTALLVLGCVSVLAAWSWWTTLWDGLP